MSRTYIPGIVENIKADSTPYTPIIEAITNSIDAINKTGRSDGKIDIYLERALAIPGIVSDEAQDIISVIIKDNGIGFNKDNRNSFDTVYGPQKKDLGGKGFGRFFFLRHFTNATVESYYEEDGKYKKRSFKFGKQYEIVAQEQIEDSAHIATGCELKLENLHRGKFEKNPEIIAHRILEQLLSYFVDSEYICPVITVHDDELNTPLVLNDRIGSRDDSLIQLKKTATFVLNGIEFHYRMFKLLHPRNQKSKIILTARNQAVTNKSLDAYVPEFATDFVEEIKKDGKDKKRNFIAQFYVQGDYLNENVTTERDSFNFVEKPDSLYPVGSNDIEQEVANIAKQLFGKEVKTRIENKKAKVETYASENIWYRPYLEDLDLDNLKMNPSESEMEATLHKAKFNKDLETKRKIAEFTDEQSSYSDSHKAAEEIIEEAKQANISELAHYIAFRKSILELFKKTIKLTEDGKYKDEKAVHDLVFPTKTTSEDTSYDGHNLWILDERLTFTQYISSDKELYKGRNKDRPDIAAFYYEVAYRETNESYSPISIFEFKKPGRHDFVNPSSDENPFDQIKRYVQAIKNGEVKTIEGLEISIGDNTPFYGYIVADGNKQIRDWLKMQDFSPLPDGQGWFYRHKEMNLYIEYITWQKLIRDAEIRHRKFFELLGAS